MDLNEEDYQDLLVIINNQIELQKYYRKHMKKQKNKINNEVEETEKRMKELIFKINKICEGS